MAYEIIEKKGKHYYKHIPKNLYKEASIKKVETNDPLKPYKYVLSDIKGYRVEPISKLDQSVHGIDIETMGYTAIFDGDKTIYLKSKIVKPKIKQPNPAPNSPSTKRKHKRRRPKGTISYCPLGHKNGCDRYISSGHVKLWH